MDQQYEAARSKMLLKCKRIKIIMKTLRFFAIVLLVCFAASEALAQKNKKEPDWDNLGTRTYALLETDMWGSFTIYCDGEIADYLEGSGFTVKIRYHFKDGEFQWYKLMNNGNIWTSQFTGEQFRVFELDKGDSGDLVWYRFNVIGDMGSHYIGRGVSKWNYEKQAWDIIELTVNCL
jgi:hypothetical protein